jgi:arsenite methyltransferase
MPRRDLLGSFAKAYDDEGHVFFRSQRMAVCERSYKLLTGASYTGQFIGIAPVQEKVPQSWCCARHTKGGFGNQRFGA